MPHSQTYVGERQRQVSIYFRWAVIPGGDVAWTSLDHCDLGGFLCESWHYTDGSGTASNDGNFLISIVVVRGPELGVDDFPYEII